MEINLERERERSRRQKETVDAQFAQIRALLDKPLAPSPSAAKPDTAEEED